MSTRRTSRRFARTAALAGAAAVLTSCGSEEPASPGEPLAAYQLVWLSDPVVSTAAPDAAGMALVEGVVYVSLPSGGVPDGEGALVTNLVTGAEVTARMIVGGFDPVALPAMTDDSLSIRIQRTAGEADRLLHAKVPPRRPPIIVRSDPAPGRRDVPLNTRILVVFSEPLDAGTVTPSAVQLTNGFQRVPTVVSFTDSTQTALAITPDTLLEAGTSYTLQLSPSLADTDGEPLPAPMSIFFATAPTGGGAQTPGCCTPLDAVFERSEPSFTGLHTEFILRADSTFSLRYSDPNGQQPAFQYDGSYQRADSIIAFEFHANAGHPMGPWAGDATMSGSQLVVRYNTHASLDDFEGGAFSLRAPGGVATPRGRLRLALSVTGVDAPASMHGVLSGDAIRSIVFDLPAYDYPTLPIGTSELSLAPGRYRLTLQPPKNCTASGPADFSITADGTSDVSLQVTCTAWGVLWVTHNVTTPNGPTLTRIVYVCEADGSDCEDHWAAPGETVMARVAAGDHRVQFAGYPDCRSVVFDRPVTVQPGQTLSMAISVACGS